MGCARAAFGSEWKRKWKGEMMKQLFVVDLDTLEATLDVRENGNEVRYTMNLSADRKDATIARTVFEPVNGGPIEHREENRTLDELKDDQATYPHHVIWAARGMWGIPLEFGSNAGQEAAPAHPDDVPPSDPDVTGETKVEPDSVRQRRRSR